MSLEGQCADFTGTSNFNSSATGSAVWFQSSDLVVARNEWTGRAVIESIQRRLGVAIDGRWGTRTNTALRAKMTAFGIDVAGVVDGSISRETLAVAIAVAVTLGANPRASALAVQICVPPGVVLPVWNVAPPMPTQRRDNVAVIVEALGVGGSTVSPTWRRPEGSTLIEAGVTDADETFVTYRTASGEVRRALLTPERMLISDRVATAEEARGNPAFPEAGVNDVLNDPGTLAPGQANAPVVPTLGGGAPTPTGIASWSMQKKVLVGGGVVLGVTFLGLLIAEMMKPTQPQPAQLPASPSKTPARAA